MSQQLHAFLDEWIPGAGGVLLQRNTVLGPGGEHRTDDPPRFLGLVASDRERGVALEHVQELAEELCGQS
jgi:hypothetical protein